MRQANSIVYSILESDLEIGLYGFIGNITYEKV